MKWKDPFYSRSSVHTTFNILSGEQEGFDFSNPKICHGKGSGGGGTNTTTSTTTPPPQVLAAYQQALSGAQTASSAPLQQYQGNTVAGFTPDQTQAFGTIANAQGTAQPYINQAQNLIQQGTQPLWNGVQQYSPSAVSQYANPYTQQVYNSQVAQEQNTDAQQQQALEGNAISSGAWGGDRAGVASAVLSGQQDLANNSTNANILNTGYNQAQGEFNTQQQAQLGANEANSYLNQQGAFGLANLGSEALGSQLSGASAQLQSGALQQQLSQEQLNVPYQQFVQQQAYPFQTGQYYANIAEGLGSNSGGTSTTTAPAPSTASQLGGLGLGGLGFLGGVLSAARGGRIYRRGGPVSGFARGGFAAGGFADDIASSVPDLSISVVPSTANGAGGSRGVGLPPPPKPEGQTNSTPSSASLLSAGKGLGGLFSLVGGGKSGSSGDVPGFGSLMQSIGGNASGDQASANYLTSSASDQVASDVAAEDAGGVGSDFFDFLKRGGAVRPRYAIGGEVLPDVVSGVGDIIGTFFGMPTAGDMGVSMLSSMDGGQTGGEGIEHRAFGSIEGEDNSDGGFKRGGMARYDGGGMVGGFSPLTASTAGQQMPTAQSYFNNMTPEQLQQYVMRLPIGSAQAQRAQTVLQQKRTMPNVGTTAQGGFGTQQPQAQPQQATMARGGRMGFADGGETDNGIYIPYPAPPSDDSQRQAEVANDAAQDDGGQPATPPMVSAQDLQAPGAMGQGTPQTVQAAMPAPQGHATEQPDEPPISEDPRKVTRAEVNPWLALAAAGFGAAAGTSPYAAVNIGKGALAGIENYMTQTKQANNVDEAADKLMTEAAQHRKQLAIDQQNADTNAQYRKDQAAYQQGELGLRGKQVAQGKYMPVKDALGNEMLFNPITKEWVQPPNNGMGTGPDAAAGGISIMNAYKQPTGPDGKPLSGDAYLATLPPQIAATAKQIANGDVAPISGFGLKNPTLLAAQNAAQNYDPTWNGRRYSEIKNFDVGKQGDTTRAFNVATGHLAMLGQLADAMNNGDTKQINALSNEVKKQFGLSSAPTNLDALRGLVSGEVVKATTGSAGALGDREEIQKNINSASSPKMIKDAISDVYLPAIKRQLEGLEQQYSSSTGLKNYRQKYLMPDTQKVLGLDMVSVKDPTGRSARIPSSDLPAALQNGWTQ